MRWYRDEQTTSRTQWPLLGLLLVALFLGHDVLMAAEAVVTPHAAGGTRHHAANLPAVSNNTHAHLNSAPASGHPETCRIGQPAIPRSADDIDGADRMSLAIGGFLIAGPPAQVTAGPFVWEEPHWPPGRLRAHFQVYRI